MKSIIQVIERSKFAAGKYDLELCKQANLELAAFLEAGEKMHDIIEEFLSHDGLSENSKRVAAALAEWEAANK